MDTNYYFDDKNGWCKIENKPITIKRIRNTMITTEDITEESNHGIVYQSMIVPSTNLFYL